MSSVTCHFSIAVYVTFFLPLVTWHFSTNNMSERRTRANVVDLQRRTRATLLIHQRIFAEFKIFKLSLEKWTYEILIGFLNCSTKTFLKICTFFLYDLLHKRIFAEFKIFKLSFVVLSRFRRTYVENFALNFKRENEWLLLIFC